MAEDTMNATTEAIANSTAIRAIERVSAMLTPAKPDLSQKVVVQTKLVHSRLPEPLRQPCADSDTRPAETTGDIIARWQSARTALAKCRSDKRAIIAWDEQQAEATTASQ